MCLTTTQVYAKTAKEDIHCYKVMSIINTHIKSIYQRHRYYINKLEKVNNFEITKYSDYLSISKGLHAFITTQPAKVISRMNAGIIYNCVIPKGSKYYLGDNSDIVSNQMIITGRYKNKD